VVNCFIGSFPSLLLTYIGKYRLKNKEDFFVGVSFVKM